MMMCCTEYTGILSTRLFHLVGLVELVEVGGKSDEKMR